MVTASLLGSNSDRYFRRVRRGGLIQFQNHIFLVFVSDPSYPRFVSRHSQFSETTQTRGLATNLPLSRNGHPLPARRWLNPREETKTKQDCTAANAMTSASTTRHDKRHMHLTAEPGHENVRANSSFIESCCEMCLWVGGWNMSVKSFFRDNFGTS